MDLALFHPQIVHFAVALGLVGVALRIWSLLGPGAWVKPAAAAILIAGSLAAVLAARSGVDAHGPIERIPGVREAVQDHEVAGDSAHNLFGAVLVLELAALALRKKEKLSRAALVASALLGLGGSYFIYQAARLGGRLVYEYAGGPGRSGNLADTSRALVAGLYVHANAERAAGNLTEAARLTDELARQMPTDDGVKLLVIDSLIGDRKDPKGALVALDALPAAPDDMRLQIQKGLLASKAHVALGNPAAAKATLQALAAKYPQSRWVARALAELK